MSYVIFDVETTITEKGHPHHKDNKAVMWGYRTDKKDVLLWPEAYPLPTNAISVGWNLKFDLQWYYLKTGQLPPRVFDCQYAFWCLRNQTNVMPSLNEALAFYGLPPKLDMVKTEYWDNGIDTDQIPPDILEEYVSRDLEATEQVYHKILEELSTRPKNLTKLIQIHNMDLLTLVKAQCHGIKYNKEGANNKKKALDGSIEEVRGKLQSYCPGVPINLDSVDHLSCLLYGGVITDTVKEPDGFFKSGLKQGQIKFRNVEKEYALPQLVKPQKKWALKKEGFYSSKESVLRQIKHPIAETLLEYAKLVKLGEYFVKIPSLIEQKGWNNDIIHAEFNQTVAVTGRLSSSNPNMQNQAPDICEFYVPQHSQFVSVDAKALEWVCVSWLSQDSVAMQEIKDGVDQHSVNQKAFNLPSRHIAKIFVFR